MASVIHDPDGRKRIQIVLGKNNRKTLWLGQVSARQADAVKVRIEQLQSALTTGIMDPEAAAWVARLDDRMHARLAGFGLLPPREQIKATLGRLLAAYLLTLRVKPGTLTTYKQTEKSLIDHFGKERLLSTITTLSAEDWRKSMNDEKLAPATVSKRIKTARCVFRAGVKWKMLPENPLDNVKAGAQTNRARLYFVPRADAEKVIAACPDAEWRLIFALSRFGGLRCPSEHLGLRWSDVDWARERILVRSPKTEGHDGRESRMLPMFPEIKTHLLTVFSDAAEKAEYVITRHRDRKVNWRTQMGRIIARAGLTQWPRMFHNLRATRQTELAARFPIHVVCAWLGNTQAVAQDHYLSVRDSDYDAALLPVGAGPDQTAHQAAQQGAKPTGTEGNGPEAESEKVPVIADDSALCVSMTNAGSDPDGIRTHVTTVKGWCPGPG